MLGNNTSRPGTAPLLLLLCCVAALAACHREPPGTQPGNVTGVPPAAPPTGAPPPAGAAGAPSSAVPPVTTSQAGAPATPPTQPQAGAPATPPQAGAPAMMEPGPEMPTAGMGAEEPPPPAREDLGMGDGRDVVTIGDSWMNYIVSAGGIEGGLDRAGTSYRHYGVAGTTLINGDIPLQYGRAKAAGADIKTVIMTGGGNDIMFTGGCNTKEACEMSVQAIADALDELWTTMADDGVKDVIYVQYSKDAGTTPQDTRPAMAPTPAICLTDRIVCHSLPTTDIVMAQLLDGIHPTPAANDRIAAAVLDMMEMQGIRR